MLYYSSAERWLCSRIKGQDFVCLVLVIALVLSSWSRKFAPIIALLTQVL